MHSYDNFWFGLSGELEMMLTDRLDVQACFLGAEYDGQGVQTIGVSSQGVQESGVQVDAGNRIIRVWARYLGTQGFDRSIKTRKTVAEIPTDQLC